MNAQDFSTQISCVRRRSLRIVNLSTRSFIERAVATRIVDERVVTRGGIQIARRIKVQAAAGVIWFPRECRNSQEDFGRGRVQPIVPQRESRNAVLQNSGGGMEKVDP